MKSQCFPKLNRVLHKKDYDSIMFNAASVKRAGVLIFFKSNNCAYARIGLSVPKRVFNSSVDRNAVKRLIRESFRLRKQHFSNLDLVVLINQKRELEALKHELQEGFNHLQEYCKKKCSNTRNPSLSNGARISASY